MDYFRNALEINNLSNLGWVGDKFTLSNKDVDDFFTKKRFDRVVVDIKWSNLFSNGLVKILPAIRSDHRPIMLELNGKNFDGRRWRRIFRFEAKWVLEEESATIIQEAWMSSADDQDPLQIVQKKLKSCEGALLRWSSLKGQEEGKCIKQKSELSNKEQSHEGLHSAATIKNLQDKISKLLEKENVKWRLKAKINWYQLGDKNMSYFHVCASQRRRKNWIKQIKDDQGRQLNVVEDNKGGFYHYFQTIFSSSNPSMETVYDCISNMEPRVTIVMNEDLQKKFTREEIEEALKQMGPLKSLGSNGFGAHFYQSYWDTGVRRYVRLF